MSVQDLTLDDDWNRRQRHPDGRDADRSGRVSLVTHQPIIRIGFAQIVQNGGELQQGQISVCEVRIEILVGTQSVSHRLVLSVSPIRREPREFSSGLLTALYGSIIGARPTRPIGRRDRYQPSCPPQSGTSVSYTHLT